MKMRDDARRRTRAGQIMDAMIAAARRVQLGRWVRDAVVLVAAAQVPLVQPVPAWAAAAAAPAHAGPDRAPAEAALLGVFAAIIVGLLSLLIRRSRVRRRHMRRAMPNTTAIGDPARAVTKFQPQLLAPAVVVILLAGVVGAAAVLGGTRHPSASQHRATSASGPVPGLGGGQSVPAASPGAQPSKPARGTTAPQPGQEPGTGLQPAAAGSGSPASSGSSRSSGSSGSGSSGPAPEPALVLPTQSVPLSLTGAIGGRPADEYGGTFPISAVNGPVTFTISEPASETNFIEVSYGNGTYTQLNGGQTLTDTVQPGDPVTITVVFSTRPDLQPPYEITVNPGGAAITFTLS